MYEYKVAEVRRVVDGDTLDLTLDLGFHVRVQTRVRLLGVNTPETYGVKKDSEEYKEGLAAKEFVQNFVDQATNLWIQSVDGKAIGQGKYGRWLVTIFDGAASLNQALLDNNHAEPYPL